jgi:methylated-DNA-protein-cysteine methyltransferase-like protein
MRKQGIVRKSADFSERVYRLIRKCPPGRVVSYGGVAALLGHPRAARGVGSALAALKDGSDVPWWRVINRNGEISIKGTLHGPILQRRLLESEGVRFKRSGRVDWKEFGWDGGRGRGRGRGTTSTEDVQAAKRAASAKKTKRSAGHRKSGRR